MHPRQLAAAAAAVVLGGLGLMAPTAEAAAPIAAGGYHPLAPTRVLDTRTGNGAALNHVGPDSTTSLQILGRGGVPTTAVAAVVMNVTVVTPTAPTFVTAYTSGTPRPNVSNVNVDPGRTRANLSTVRVGTDGKVNLYNYAGVTDIIGDVLGWYDTDGTAGGFVPDSSKSRVLDTRDPSNGGPVAVPAGGAVVVGLDYNPVTNGAITAVRVNVTAVSPEGLGYLTAWNAVGTPPLASTVNFTPGDTVPNAAIVRTSMQPFGATKRLLPAIAVENASTGRTHVIVDIVGFYQNGVLNTDLRFQPLTPTRILDTRTGAGGLTRFGAAQTQSGSAPAAIADANTFYLSGNFTVVAPTAPTNLVVWQQGQPRPITTNLNASPGQTVANAASVPESYSVYNNAGTADVIIDVFGRFQLNPPGAAAGTSFGAAGRGSH